MFFQLQYRGPYPESGNIWALATEQHMQLLQAYTIPSVYSWKLHQQRLADQNKPHMTHIHLLLLSRLFNSSTAEGGREKWEEDYNSQGISH